MSEPNFGDLTFPGDLNLALDHENDGVLCTVGVVLFAVRALFFFVDEILLFFWSRRVSRFTVGKEEPQL